MIGKIVKVIIDRPLGSYHPKHKDIYYSVNYGFIEGIIAGDGEDQDAYVLGIDEPVKQFTGKVIAIINRFDDVEDKLVVVPEELILTKEEILKQVNFQEKYFNIEIIM
jgi:inorganic pyrophosphatase